MSPPRPPPPAVLAAFGLAGTPKPLRGGMTVAWRVEATVLKRIDSSAEHATAIAEILERVPPDSRFRIARPRRTAGGELLTDGWVAAEWLPGRHRPAWRAIVAAGEAFHAALSGERRPSVLDGRTDPWAVADRVAWNERPLDAAAPGVLRELVEALGPPAPATLATSRLIHGDLSGNVLFERGEPPGIIDFSPYWRPPSYATAIVVIDALWLGGAGPGVTSWARARKPGFEELLHRALLFRAVTQWLLRPDSFDAATVARIRALDRLVAA